VIEKAEFTPRIAGMKQRLSLIEERRQAAEHEAGLERGLSFIISCTEDFAAKVVRGLDNLDSYGRREITHRRAPDRNQSGQRRGQFPRSAKRRFARARPHKHAWRFATLYGRTSSEPSLGSADAEGSPRIGNASIAKRSPSCALPSIRSNSGSR